MSIGFIWGSNGTKQKKKNKAWLKGLIQQSNIEGFFCTGIDPQKAALVVHQH